MDKKELKELKLTKHVIIPFPNFQPNTIISPTQVNDNFEEIEFAYNQLIDLHNGAISKVNDLLDIINESDNESVNNEILRVQAEKQRVIDENERKTNEIARTTEEGKRIAMYNIHMNDELARQNAENARVLAEQERVANYSFMTEDEQRRRDEFTTYSLSETNRVEAENTRASNEQTRIANEKLRVSAETLRDTTYKTIKADEEIRKTNESNRISKETQRVLDENIRKSSESVRIENENARKASEITRDSNENSRKVNETTRNDNENTRILNEKQRAQSEEARNTNELARNQQHNTKMTEVSNKIVDVENRMQTIETTFDSLVDGAGFATKEYVDSKVNVITANVEGSYITVTDSVEGNITNIEILGNTVQNATNLADIKSCGIPTSDGHFKMSILSCSKNLFNFNSQAQGYESVATLQGDTIKVEGKWYASFSISVKPNTNYKINYIHSGARNSVAIFKPKENTTTQIGVSTFNSGDNKQLFVYLYSGSGTSGISYYTNLQIEEGTQATQYEPHQSNKCDILLPCQLDGLEKGDRLYYDEVEKAWCIEKWNVTSTVKFEDVTEYRKLDVTDVLLFKKPLDSYGYGISNGDDFDTYLLEGKGVVKNGYNALIGIGNITNTSADRIGIGYEKGTFSSKEEAYEDIKNKTLYYKLKVPQKIVLPLDVQIQLNSFFGTTHMWLECGEVEGTIKATVPKSLGASVQSLSTKTDMLEDRVEAIEGLKDSQNMTYQTDKGYLVAKATQNGVVKDLKIQGKTLVNLIDFSSIVTGGSASGNFIKSNNYIKATLTSSGSKTCYIKPMIDVSNRLITVIIDNKSTSYCNFDKRNGFVNIKNLKSGLNIFTVNTDNLEQGFSIGFTGTLNASDVIEFSIMILEGDHTQNPPSYFEGLKSVGQDVDVIEVLSVKSDGNLFDVNNLLPYSSTKSSYRIGDRNTIYAKKTQEASGIFTCYLTLDVEPGVNYTLSANRSDTSKCNLYVYDTKNGVATSDRGIALGSLSSDGKLTFKAISKGITIGINLVSIVAIDVEYSFSEICLVKGDVVKPFSYKKHHTKHLLYYNELGELVSVPVLRQWDSVEEKNDKTLYTVASSEVVLNGSESEAWYKVNGDLENTMQFGLPMDISFHLANVLCDKFTQLENKSIGTDVEAITMLNNSSSKPVLYVRISRSKLSTQDLAGFKAWLQANPITVVYQLATPKVYECPNLNLSSYSNETMISCDSGNVSPKLEFSITSHVNELVKNNQARINQLEERMMNMFKSVLSGDMQTLAYSLYPDDFDKGHKPELLI